MSASLESSVTLHSHRFSAMGSPCELRLYLTETQAPVPRQLEQEVQRLERKYSRYLDDSELSAINRVAASGGSIEVDAETAALLDYADQCFQTSQGLFDITTGLLRQAWDFKQGVRPDPQTLKPLLERIGWQKLDWRSPTLHFQFPAMELDFGGIVKEYAVDSLIRLSRQLGVGAGLIDLGGDIGVIGPHPDGSPWVIGIRHPRQPERAISRISVHQGCLASSGDYERYFIEDSVRYCHLLNPSSGQPVQGAQAVSVVAGFCVVAGMAATTAMLMEKNAEPWLQELGLNYFLIDKQGELHASGQ